MSAQKRTGGASSACKTWRVEGMHCPHCESAVRRALSGAEGLRDIEVSYKKGTLTALWDASLLSEAQIDARLREAGYSLVRGSARPWVRDILRLLAALVFAAALYELLTRTVVADWARAFPTARAGMPVEWTIHAEADHLNSCNSEIFIPAFDLSIPLQPGDNVIRFTPEQEGAIPYTCWMGMIRSTIYVTGDG